jgi:hypothetical protein
MERTAVIDICRQQKPKQVTNSLTHMNKIKKISEALRRWTARMELPRSGEFKNGNSSTVEVEYQ